MLPRTTIPLVVTYILLIGAGIIFIITPPPSFSGAPVHGYLTTVWAAFYLVGGLISLSTIILRAQTRAKKLVSIWNFEIAGLSLLVAANLIYSYALLRTGLIDKQYNFIAFSLVISAFASSFVGRVFDVFALIKAVNPIAAPREDPR